MTIAGNEHWSSGCKLAMKPLDDLRPTLVDREDHDIGVEAKHGVSVE